MWILLRLPERHDSTPIDLPWIPGHEFSGSSKRLAVSCGIFAKVMPCSAPPWNGGVRGVSGCQGGGHPQGKPSNLSFEEAASVPWRPKTAWQGIFTHGHLEKGQTILIHGGPALWRLCVNWQRCRCHRHCTASGDDEAYLNSSEASRVIDYREAQFRQGSAREGRCGFDLIGGDTQRAVIPRLKEGGHLVSAIQPVSQEETARHRVVGRDDEARAVRDVLAESRDCWKRGQYGQTSRPCTRSRMAARPGRTSPGTCRGSWDVGPQWAGSCKDAGHTARSCSVVVYREHEIRGRAYELYLARGHNLRELEDWLQAERELTAE